MISLKPKTHSSLGIEPRFPYREVLVSEEALHRLEIAQSLLPKSVKLILTRGFEPGNNFLRLMHFLARLLGASVFAVIYPHRINEIHQIFSPNGHTTDGNHIDVSVQREGERISLLPLGVFTSVSQTNRTLEQEDWLSEVYSALESAGFSVHPNKTEALQIHCDLHPPAFANTRVQC